MEKIVSYKLIIHKRVDFLFAININ